MKYLLVKEYPGSPALGTIVNQLGDGKYGKVTCECSLYREFSKSEIEKYPEFWKPLKNFSSLTNSEIGSLHWLNTNMGYVLRVGEAIYTKEHPSNYYVDWGKRIEEISKETMEHFKDKLK